MEEQNLGENLIAMSGQDGTFAVNRRSRCKGYLKIEASRGKGMVWIAAENLRFFEKEQYSYKLILFGKKKMQTVFKVFGSLPVDSSGRGEAHFAFDPKDVDGKGSSLTDFSLAIVAAASQTDPKETLHPVLRGNLSREYLRQSRPAAAAQQKPLRKLRKKLRSNLWINPQKKPQAEYRTTTITGFICWKGAAASKIS